MPTGLKRYQQSKQFHFITFSCYQRKPLLLTPEAKTIFEQVLEQIRSRHTLAVAGYVVMPEHVHLLVDEPPVTLLSTVLQVLKQATSRQLKEPEPVRFWQTRYYDFNVSSYAKYLEKLRYIHRNPVQRGLVEHPEDYPWSSFRRYALREHGTVTIEAE
jgi:putative transposase